ISTDNNLQDKSSDCIQNLKKYKKTL
uniref:Uncharacterized protein n=1 Tax=Panagrolaimus sp. JU765 TaxID=591449 RepID=A0AC34Q0Z0_9BILA